MWSVSNPKPGSLLYNAKIKKLESDNKVEKLKEKCTEENKNILNDYKNKIKESDIKYENKKNECSKIKNELDKLNPGFTEDDINQLDEMIKVQSLPVSKYNLGLQSAQQNKNDIFDMRNLNGKNFRSNKALTKLSSVLKDDKNNSLYEFSPSKSYYMNMDYLFTNSLSSPSPIGQINFKNLPEIQRLIINEFQPYDMLSVADLLPNAANALSNVAQGVANMVGGFIMNAARNSITNLKIKEASTNPEKTFGYLNDISWRGRGRSFFTSDPVQQVQNMFNGGKWLNTYEVPFYGNEYLQGTNSGKWTLGAAKESIGAMSLLTNTAGADFPSNPKFKVDMKSSSRPEIKTEFYLINANDQWLFRNFQFIQAIFAGTSWMHLNYCIIRPPNIYNVLCPGRFHLVWAAMDCSVTFCGKLRKNRNVSKKLANIGINSIDEDMLWPDAWKISLNIKDFTPNNFNMYADYYINGYNPDEIVNLENQISLEDAVSDMMKYFDELKSEVVDAGKKTVNNMANSAKNAIERLQKINDDVSKDKNGQ